MIGPQNGVVKAELGALLNGLVNYEYWLPVPSLMNPEIQSLIETYQSRAEKTGADPLGYYVAPLAHAQLQVLEQAIREVGSTDDPALSDYTRKATFETVVGTVTFGEGGGCAQADVLRGDVDLVDRRLARGSPPELRASGCCVRSHVRSRGLTSRPAIR